MSLTARSLSGYTTARRAAARESSFEPISIHPHYKTIINNRNKSEESKQRSNSIVNHSSPSPINHSGGVFSEKVSNMLSFCGGSHIDSDISSAAIKERVAQSNQRIKCVKSGSSFHSIAHESTSVAPEFPAASSILQYSHTENYREEHNSSPTSVWLELCELISQTATQLKALITMSYFDLKQQPAKKLQILRQIHPISGKQRTEEKSNHRRDAEDPGLPSIDLSSTEEVEATLARCFADFDLTQKDLRCRLFESLKLIEKYREQHLRDKYSSFRPKYGLADIDIKDMRANVEKSKVAVLKRKYGAYLSLAKLIDWISSKQLESAENNKKLNAIEVELNSIIDYMNNQTLANTNNRDHSVPSNEEILAIKIFLVTIENGEIEVGNSRSFTEILRNIGQELMNYKEIKELMLKLAELWQISEESYYSCIEKAKIIIKKDVTMLKFPNLTQNSNNSGIFQHKHTRSVGNSASSYQTRHSTPASAPKPHYHARTASLHAFQHILPSANQLAAQGSASSDQASKTLNSFTLPANSPRKTSKGEAIPPINLSTIQINSVAYDSAQLAKDQALSTRREAELQQLYNAQQQQLVYNSSQFTRRMIGLGAKGSKNRANKSGKGQNGSKLGSPGPNQHEYPSQKAALKSIMQRNKAKYVGVESVVKKTIDSGRENSENEWGLLKAVKAAIEKDREEAAVKAAMQAFNHSMGGGAQANNNHNNSSSVHALRNNFARSGRASSMPINARQSGTNNVSNLNIATSGGSSASKSNPAAEGAQPAALLSQVQYRFNPIDVLA
jgi:predicted hydrocarbon binding protein